MYYHLVKIPCFQYIMNIFIIGNCYVMQDKSYFILLTSLPISPSISPLPFLQKNLFHSFLLYFYFLFKLFTLRASCMRGIKTYLSLNAWFILLNIIASKCTHFSTNYSNLSFSVLYSRAVLCYEEITHFFPSHLLIDTNSGSKFRYYEFCCYKPVHPSITNISETKEKVLQCYHINKKIV